MASASSYSTLGLIGISGRKFTRNLAVLSLVAGVLALSGCGGDDEEPATTAATAPAETAATETTPTAEDEPAETEPADTGAETEPPEAPEEQPGGAGDEEPARTLALFTGRGGRITPRVVRVPAFISIQVELRSGDGANYALRFGNVTVRAGGDLNSTSKTLDGLRPNEGITGRPLGTGNRVRIEATAEPGP
jgi:hypothetical protein